MSDRKGVRKRSTVHVPGKALLYNWVDYFKLGVRLILRPCGGACVSRREGARKPIKKGSEIKVATGKMAGRGRAERSSGLLTPGVINKSVSSRTPMMIWAELFHLSPEVIQGYSKNGRPSLCVYMCVYMCARVSVCLSCFFLK